MKKTTMNQQAVEKKVAAPEQGVFLGSSAHGIKADAPQIVLAPRIPPSTKSKRHHARAGGKLAQHSRSNRQLDSVQHKINRLKPYAQAARTLCSFAVLGLASASLSIQAGTATKVLPSLNANNSRLSSPNVLKHTALTGVASIEIQASRGNLPANGRSLARLKVRVLNRDGQAVAGDVPLTIEVTRGRIVAPGIQGANALSTAAADLAVADPGNQVIAKNGQIELDWQSPSEPGPGQIRVWAGDRQITASQSQGRSQDDLTPSGGPTRSGGIGGVLNIDFTPDLREMIAVGLIEGVIRFNNKRPTLISTARASDGFEQELRRFSRDFSNGKGAYGGRAAVFLKGRIKGQTLLTASYDSDKAVRDRLFRDIRPEEFYPVYGDASVHSFDAQSASPLYVRLDNKRNFLLWGDFTTDQSASQNPSGSDGNGVAGSVSDANTSVNDDNVSVLGRYSRALTGAQGQWSGGGKSKDRFQLRGFASLDSLRQVVDEIPARGISGPYTLRYANGLAGSERVELIVRDRNAPSVILKITPLVRFIDYDFEPFSGRLLFKAPQKSLDEKLNPISIRTVYEVEDGGESYWVYGGEARLKLGAHANKGALGAAYARDKNPLADYELTSLNLHVQLAAQTHGVMELAHSRNGDVSNFGFTPLAGGLPTAPTLGARSGLGARAEVRHDGERLQARIYAQKTGAGFNNAAATPNLGTSASRLEAGGKSTYAVTPTVRATGEVLHSEDGATGGTRSGAYVGGAWDATPKLTLEAGVRHSQQRGAGATIPATGTAGIGGSAVPGTGINPYNGGSLIDPTSLVATANNPYTTTSLKGKADYRLTTAASVFIEGERTLDRNAEGAYGHALAVGGEYRFADVGRAYARTEWASGLGGDYGLYGSGRQSATVIGLDAQYMRDGQIFSEYRLRDAIGGAEAVAAVGLRNVWRLGQSGWRLNTAFERVRVLQNSTATAQAGEAIALGLDYLNSEIWKGSSRLEWRRDGANLPLGATTSWLYSLGVARKLSEDWTLLARDIYLKKNAPGLDADSTQNRFQIGAAWRETQTNVWNALARYENWRTLDKAAGENSRKHIVSVDATYHPRRPWWLMGKVASKWVNAKLACTPSCVNFASNAQLIQGRVIYDITPRWDVGLIGSMLADNRFKNRNFGVGAEVGYLMMENLWLSAGYNFRGLVDKDLLTDESSKGAYLRLRFKFDEKLFGRVHDVESKDGVRADRSVVPGAH
jgi:hypothetical protein